MECRPGCGACCIAPSISSRLPGMPGGKPAGVRCVNLDEHDLCRVWGTDAYPDVCRQFAAMPDVCGTNATEALVLLAELEARTTPENTPATGGGVPSGGRMARIPDQRQYVSPQEAIEIQQRLRVRVVSRDDFGTVGRVAGADVHYDRHDRMAQAAVVVLKFPELEFLESALARIETPFPYLPGLLSFREVPAVLAALERLEHRPDLLFCDGHGLAHPRRFGLACHLGVISGIPSIGVAKKSLIGTHSDLPQERGGSVSLEERGETVGAVVRTRSGVKPLYVSVGHRVSLPTAVRFVLACAPQYRLPEPARQAHRLARGWSRE